MLANDTDADDDPLTAELVTGVSHGTLVLNANGSYLYTPPANWSGTATFMYRAYDGAAYSDGATVSIAVTPVNDAPTANADAATTAEDTALTVAAVNGVLANDSDPDSLLITAAQVANPAHGTLALAANGSYVYTPAANWNGTDTFTYRAYDGTSYSDIETATITVTPVNDPPVAATDGPYSTPEGTALVLSAPGVLANDTDVEGDPLTAVKLSNPAHGTLVLNVNGSATYTPAAGYSGSDSFTYRASDGLALSAPITVSITVVPKPATTLAVTSAPTTIDHGSRYAFTGVLKLGTLGLPGQTITLEQSADGTDFSASSLTGRTGVGGAFSISAGTDQQDVVPGDVRRDGLPPRLNERGGDGLGSPLRTNPDCPQDHEDDEVLHRIRRAQTTARGRHEAGADLQVQEGRQDVEGIRLRESRGLRLQGLHPLQDQHAPDDQGQLEAEGLRTR